MKESEKEVPTLDDPLPRQGTVAAPFPQRLTPPNKGKNFIEIGEVLRKVNINIPLLDAINQIPSYAKYLKDLCTVKRQLNVRKKSFATEHVSAIAQHNAPLKLKDPGSPTITCVIGTKVINDALLDLGSSVNLMPYSVYLQLGLGEMKPTSVVLQLADRSMAKPRGFIEDVLVQVDKFYYPVDFVILDLKGAKPGKGSDLILGRPFLATCNAIINCRDGQMKLSFGNMKVELNIFKTCKIVPNLEEVEEVNCIKTCVNEYFIDEFEKPLHSIDFEHKELNEFNFEQEKNEFSMGLWDSETIVSTPLLFAGGLDTFLQGGFSNSIDQELHLLNSVEKLQNDDEFDFASWYSFFPNNDMNSLNNFSVGQDREEGDVAYEMLPLKETTNQSLCDVPKTLELPIPEPKEDIKELLLGIPLLEPPPHNFLFHLHLFHDPFFFGIPAKDTHVSTFIVSLQENQGNAHCLHNRQVDGYYSWQGVKKMLLKKISWGEEAQVDFEEEYKELNEQTPLHMDIDDPPWVETKSGVFSSILY